MKKNDYMLEHVRYKESLISALIILVILILAFYSTLKSKSYTDAIETEAKVMSAIFIPLYKELPATFTEDNKGILSEITSSIINTQRNDLIEELSEYDDYNKETIELAYMGGGATALLLMPISMKIAKYSTILVMIGTLAVIQAIVCIILAVLVYNRVEEEKLYKYVI